ncbi:hypothetical protein [Dactylosporangium sp. CA-139066]|uniref:hypothetical protein n=1 Tax=Dactylosporangium sp. CA-139066 TaxID=3239930 RepID=UPI003D92F70B
MPDDVRPIRHAGKIFICWASLLANFAMAACSSGHDATPPPYRLPTPAVSDTAAAKAHLDGPGASIIALHHMVQPLLASYSAAACTDVMTALRGPAGVDAAAAASTTPDSVLGELVVDELHVLAGMNTCPAGASTGQLATVDRLLGERLHQLGEPA